MCGTAKETHNPNLGVCVHAGTECIPHQHSRAMDTRSLAGTTHHLPDHHCYYYNLPHLETQA